MAVDMLEAVAQISMPSPNNARKASAKKTPEKKVDLGLSLARKRSQDFASKIQGWNEAGGGVAQHEVEVIVDEDEKQETNDVRQDRAEDDTAQVEVEPKPIDRDAEQAVDAVVKEISPDSPRTPGNITPKVSATKKAIRDVDLGRGAWVRRKSKPQVDTPEVKHAGTPKKRVVSDGHWRRDRQPKEEMPAKEKDTTPKPSIIRKSVVSVGMKIPPSYQDFAEPEPDFEPLRVRPLRPVRSRSPSTSFDDRADTPDYESSGTKIYIKRRARSKVPDEELKPPQDPRKSASSLTTTSSVDKRSSATGITTSSASSPTEPTQRPLSAPRTRTEMARPSNTGDRPPSSRKLREVAKPERTVSDDAKKTTETSNQEEHMLRTSRSAEAYAKRITEHIKKPIGSPASPLPPKVYGNRIEGWLANMPDPFTEETRASLTPEPLEISKRARKKPDLEVDTTNVTNIIRKRDSGQNLNQQNDYETQSSSEIRDQKVTPPVVPTSLKRRGARHGSVSPVKGRPTRAKTFDSDALMSGALPDPPQHISRRPSEPSKKFRIPSGGRLLSEIPSIDHIPPLRMRHDARHDRITAREDDFLPDSSVLSRASDGDSPRRNKSGLKRRLTQRADLMSGIPMSKDDSHPVLSTGSLRKSRRKHEPATIGDVMNELSTDELKYQRELRTLVDGVIPVLLQHAVSGSNDSKGPRVFSQPTNDTKPIVDMGIALERLKTTHKWIPMYEPSELVAWADGAAKVYMDYLHAWRLGFRDIVINLAPAEHTPRKNGPPALGDGLPRNKDGYLLGASGERVDVAHLLKRPLARIKYLAKTFEDINHLQPSADVEDITAKWQKLITKAKQRVKDEQARLEDEAAACIDTTRARDPRSLAPITGVTIDATRSVRARDYFDMDLTHSSGQQLGCKIEILYRDDAPDRGKAGDVLFCEITAAGRWLLFPPLPCSLVTAREGDRSGEIVVMIRGFLSDAQQWREVLSLRTSDDHTSKDWLQMLGSWPVPPRLSKKSSFNMRKEARSRTLGSVDPIPEAASDHLPGKHWDASLREIEVPIGEKTNSASRVWDGSEVNSVQGDGDHESLRRARPTRYRDTASSANAGRANTRHKGTAAQPSYFYDTPEQDRFFGQAAQRPLHSRSKSDWTGSSVTTTSQGYSVWLPSTDSRLSDESSTEEDNRPARRPSTRPGMQRRTSSVPSLDMPNIPKLRKSAQPIQTPPRSESPSSDRDLLPSQKRAAAQRAERAPVSAPSKMQKGRLTQPREDLEKEHGERSAPPAPPAHSRPLSLGVTSKNLPSLTPAFLKKTRRSSSPLKHEYEPSTASDPLSDSELSESTDTESQTSESTIEEVVEEGVSTVGDLKAFQEYARRGIRHSPPPPSQPTLPEASLTPSESASQAPYRSVPPTAAAPVKTVANVFTWSDRGSWDSLHPEECHVFVTPGLIEAFDLTQANSVSLNVGGEGSTPSSKGIKPLVALELTPLVPLRRGTAVDISIRSPPTTNSLIRTGNNIMFRSRSPEECEKLYALINRARIDNPTYIALQHARGPVQQSNWGEVMDKRNAARTASAGSRSWWNLGSRKTGSYRSKGSRTLSIAATESSVGTMNSAFSALRRFSGSSRIFDIARSTITSREGTRSSHSESLSSGLRTPVPFDPQMGTPVGVTNTKVRLYVRDGPSKWRDMGAARLTIMLPPRQNPAAAADPATIGLQKRVLVYSKSHGGLLLDVTLGENSFERIARTGIAVSVYEEADHVGAEGGVLVAKTTVYMIQMKSEREAAYTFSLVGKLRY